MVRGISEAIVGMAGGQALELALVTDAGGDEIEAIHQRKTAALFVLVARLVSSAGGADVATATHLERFAAAFGAAYQIVDDLQDRDVEGEQRGNLARVLGAEPARARAQRRLQDGREAIEPLGMAAARLAQCTEWLAESLEATR
jgi:hypothetical protein